MNSGTIRTSGTYVPDFAYDVFVRFAHLDNRRFGPRPPWVTCLVHELETYIQVQLGTRKKPAIFFDERGNVEGGRPLKSELARSAAAAATFLAITSPAYVDKESWALYELRAFQRSQSADRRIFPIEFLPIDHDHEYPGALGGLVRPKFWAENKDRIPAPFSPKSQPLCQKLWNLCYQMGCHLKSMRASRIGDVPSLSAHRVPKSPANASSVIISES